METWRYAIVWDITMHHYAVWFDGELIGFAPSYVDADTLIRDRLGDLDNVRVDVL